jgi:hypothetical protein
VKLPEVDTLLRATMPHGKKMYSKYHPSLERSCLIMLDCVVLGVDGSRRQHCGCVLGGLKVR